MYRYIWYRCRVQVRGSIPSKLRRGCPAWATCHGKKNFEKHGYKDSNEDRASHPQAPAAIISALDAEKTEENLRMGRPLAEPAALSVKRTMKHEYQV